MSTPFPNTTTRDRSEAQAIRTAAIEYDRAVHQHGPHGAATYRATIALCRALIAGGFDDPFAEIENSEAELERGESYVHLTPDRLPRSTVGMVRHG